MEGARDAVTGKDAATAAGNKPAGKPPTSQSPGIADQERELRRILQQMHETSAADEAAGQNSPSSMWAANQRSQHSMYQPTQRFPVAHLDALGLNASGSPASDEQEMQLANLMMDLLNGSAAHEGYGGDGFGGLQGLGGIPDLHGQMNRHGAPPYGGQERYGLSMGQQPWWRGMGTRPTPATGGYVLTEQDLLSYAQDTQQFRPPRGDEGMRGARRAQQNYRYPNGQQHPGGYQNHNHNNNNNMRRAHVMDMYQQQQVERPNHYNQHHQYGGHSTGGAPQQADVLRHYTDRQRMFQPEGSGLYGDGRPPMGYNARPYNNQRGSSGGGGAGGRVYALNITLPITVPYGTVKVTKTNGENYYEFSDQYPCAQVLFSQAAGVCDTWATFLQVPLGQIRNVRADQINALVDYFSRVLLGKGDAPIESAAKHAKDGSLQTKTTTDGTAEEATATQECPSTENAENTHIQDNKATDVMPESAGAISTEESTVKVTEDQDRESTAKGKENDKEAMASANDETAEPKAESEAVDGEASQLPKTSGDVEGAKPDEGTREAEEKTDNDAIEGALQFNEPIKTKCVGIEPVKSLPSFIQAGSKRISGSNEDITGEPSKLPEKYETHAHFETATDRKKYVELCKRIKQFALGLKDHLQRPSGAGNADDSYAQAGESFYNQKGAAAGKPPRSLAHLSVQLATYCEDPENAEYLPLLIREWGELEDARLATALQAPGWADLITADKVEIGEVRLEHTAKKMVDPRFSEAMILTRQMAGDEDPRNWNWITKNGGPTKGSRSTSQTGKRLEEDPLAASDPAIIALSKSPAPPRKNTDSAVNEAGEDLKAMQPPQPLIGRYVFAELSNVPDVVVNYQDAASCMESVYRFVYERHMMVTGASTAKGAGNGPAPKESSNVQL